MAPETTPTEAAGLAAVLTGRIAEYQELLGLLDARPGLTVVEADPWSGTSALLRAALQELDGDWVLVDARSAADALDLAMAIADAAVERLEPEAAAWWTGNAPPTSAAGLRLARSLNLRGVDADELRGRGPWDRRMDEAMELVTSLGGASVTLAIDHAGLLLSALSVRDARELLGLLRAVRQRHHTLDLVLVEHSDGVASAALTDSTHPLFRAGHRLRFRRPEPIRFVQDLAITRGWTGERVEMVHAAAELADGVPALTWEIRELASNERSHEDRALTGWRRLRRATELCTARQWDSLRRVHPLAQSIVAALASDLRPHAVEANSKSVNDALRRLRDLGMAWQPEPRQWRLADPLLAAWARDHPPAWVVRRR
jgi:hypothetical protein